MDILFMDFLNIKIRIKDILLTKFQMYELETWRVVINNLKKKMVKI